jgi:two-component system sensor histidine kinase HydH
MTTTNEDPIPDAPPGNGLKWRVGLLVTTLLMGLALVVTGMERYRTTLATSRAITEAEVTAILRGARRELVRFRGEQEEILAGIHEELAGQGVSYVALLDRAGRVVASAGEARRPPALTAVATPQHRWTAPRIDRFEDEGLVHGFAVLGRGRRGPADRAAGAQVLAVELAPERERRVVSSARRALLIEFGAAAALLIVALVFWRMSLGAERLSRLVLAERLAAAAERERDRQLKLLGQMSAVLGHEIRNPVAALKGHAQLLGERLDPGSAAGERARTILDQVNDLEKLAEQVLDFARTRELTLEKVYVDDLTSAAVAFADADPVEIAVPEDLPPWRLDRKWMERALVNLLRNAREASPEGASVEIGARVDGDLCIEVSDVGAGIAPGDEERIFEPFYTSRARGTGLGLALVRRIVEDHGGAVVARSRTTGRGAVFTVRIPPSKE